MGASPTMFERNHVVGEPPAMSDEPVERGADHRPVLASSLVKRRLMLADCVAVMIGVAAAFFIQAAVRPIPVAIQSWHVILCLTSIPGFMLGAKVNRLYQARANERPSRERRNVVLTVAVTVSFMVLVAFVVKFDALSRLWVVLVTVCMTTTLLIDRTIARRIFRRLRSTGRLIRRIVIVGTDAHAIGLLHTYRRNPHLGYEVVGFVGGDDIGERAGARVLGGFDDIERLLAEHGAIGVVVSLSGTDTSYVNRITRRLTDAGFHVSISSGLADIDVTRLRPQTLAGRTMIYVEPVIRDGMAAVTKRIFDVVVASFILVVTIPLWIVSVIAIKLSDGGPVFYRQQRVGLGGELFMMTKLRTMVVDADRRRSELCAQSDVDGPLFKMYDDPRITRVGRVLRRFSIDELPQLLSVLRGNMSMVGPRPALPDEVAQWEPEVFDRLRVLPGLTGMWQISGRSSTTFEQYLRLDLYYVDNWSLAHDVRICVRTIGTVLRGSGAA